MLRAVLFKSLVVIHIALAIAYIALLLRCGKRLKKRKKDPDRQERLIRVSDKIIMRAYYITLILGIAFSSILEYDGWPERIRFFAVCTVGAIAMPLGFAAIIAWTFLAREEKRFSDGEHR